ncbi:hypothetical protein GWI33_001885 [Rhynchophorus ferrugineus]|uniref:Uncharacterized protein n=1 Tax=Rhynchophorus ferrugineus TaxID=354439 RepID=A0A834MJV5_RHYFE|nr:hypothetical protein GWI33_001885 [Rhynchophorus ferrugineus]
MKIGAFVDRKKKHFEDPQLDMPFCTFFADKVSLNDHNVESETNSLATSPDNERVNGSSPADEPVTPLREEAEKNGNGVEQQDMSMVSTGDDFIMLDLKTPFAKPSGEKIELTKFFREWQQAPLLETFKDLPPVQVTDLQKQLETYESDMQEFDSIVSSFCQGSPNNN